MRHFKLNMKGYLLLLVLLCVATSSFGVKGMKNTRDELIPFDSFLNSETPRTKRERLSLLVVAMSLRRLLTRQFIAQE